MIDTWYQPRQPAGGNAVSKRKKFLLRLDPAVHDALTGWAADELRSTNAQIEFLLRRLLADAGRLSRHARNLHSPERPDASGRVTPTGQSTETGRSGEPGRTGDSGRTGDAGRTGGPTTSPRDDDQTG
jgi:hypothetical protein